MRQRKLIQITKRKCSSFIFFELESRLNKVLLLILYIADLKGTGKYPWLTL